MEYAARLYTTEKTKKSLPRILLKLRMRRPQPKIWLITLASNEKNLLDIFWGTYYIQPMFQKQNPYIVGIAEDEEQARLLTVKILEDVYQKQGNFDVRTYFEFRE